MKIFTNNPALKLLIIIILGIIIGNNYDVNDAILLYIIILAVIISFIFVLFKKIFPAYLILGLTIGFCISAQLNQLSFNTPNKIIPTSSALLEGRIVKTLKKTSYSYRCIVEGKVDHKALPLIKNTNVILNIKGLNKNPIELFAGNDIACPVKIRLPHKAVLPTEINEEQYAASIDVQWIADASAKKISIIRRHNDINFYRELVVSEIERKIDLLFSEKNFGIILALLTGDQTRVPQTLRRDFSLTGTTHVLSVSGLHVGVIAAVLFILLGFVRMKWLKLVFFTILVSAFVVMTGMQPPAIRAGIMAVIALLINTTQRRVSAINVIALSIILVIIFSPNLIYSMGFQMSAAAWLGLAYASSTDFLIALSVWLNKFLLKIPLSSLEGNITILFSVLISIGLIYALLSNSRKQLLFRLGISICVCYMSLALYNGTTDKREIKIYPRENYVAAFVPISENKTFILLSDRKPAQYPSRDYSMERLLLENPDSLVIGYTGNVGINITDKLKYRRSIQHFPVSLDLQIKIEKVLNIETHLP